MKKNICVLFLLSAVCTCQAARFLAFFPFPAKSHHFVFRPIIEGLAEKGHQVLYITGFPYDKLPTNVQQINVLPDFAKEMEKKNFNPIEFGEMSVPMTSIVLFEIGLEIGNFALTHPEVQKLIHSQEKFDAILFESFFVQEYLSAFIHKFNALGIEIIPLGDCAWVNELTGAPDNYAYQIDYKMYNTDDLTFIQRLYNMYITLTTTVIGYGYLWRMQSYMDRHFNYTGWESRPPLTQLVKNRTLILTNSHFSVGYSVPLAPHRKEIGGIHIKPNKPLPKELQKYMDEAKDGVIFMSLGSHINVSEVAGGLRDEFMAAFERLPQRVLLKWEKEYSGNLPANVKLGKWFPQQDILAHKNLALFITHGGLLSLMEAVYNGVPVIGIPVFADQPRNLHQVEAAGYGRMLWFRNLTRDNIEWTIKEVLNNKRYKEEAQRRSILLKDRRNTPLEDALYWIEYSLRHPNALTPRGALISAIALHSLDIYMFLGAIALVFLVLLAKVCCMVRGRKTNKPAVKEKKKKH